LRQDEAKNLKQAEMNESDPPGMMCKPVLAGTRIAVELILETLPAGDTTEQSLAAYPRITREGTNAALTSASEAL
jgi:uncharacterized protein (DUF433 family)